MIVFVGFSEYLEIILETRSEINKLEKGIFFAIDNNTKIEYNNNINLTSYDFSNFHIVDYFNAKIFEDLFHLQFNKLIKNVFNFFKFIEDDYVEDNLNEYIFLKEYFQNKIKKIDYISSAFEICIIIIAQIVFKLRFDKSICFNLPGGGGKTHCIDWLQKLYYNKILVTTPTAKAAVHYNEKNVKTNHSTFLLNPNELKKSKRYINEDTIIFDEASMLSEEILVALENIIKNKSCYFIGDFAQLNPVLSKNILNKNILHIINASDNFYCPRFNNPSFINFLNLIRKKILEPLTNNFDKIEIKNYLYKFKRKSNLEILNIFFKNSVNEFKINYRNIEKYEYNFQNNQPIVSSRNDTCEQINNLILNKIKSKNDFLPSNIFVQRNLWVKNSKTPI